MISTDSSNSTDKTDRCSNALPAQYVYMNP
jgi:hypothetical protein